MGEFADLDIKLNKIVKEVFIDESLENFCPVL